MLNSTEAVYGFAAWLTTRDRTLLIGAKHDTSEMARLVALFCTENNLPVADMSTCELQLPEETK